MNPHILTFVGGAFAGAAAVYVGITVPMKRRLTEEIYAKFDDDIRIVREYYERKSKEEADEKAEVISEAPATVVETVVTPAGSEVVDPIDEKVAMEEAAYSAEVISAEEGYTMVNDEPLHPGDDEYYHTDKTEAVGGIEHISDDVFQENEWGYPKVFMKYFPKDDVLLDTDNSAVEDVRGIVGDYLEDIRTNELFAIVNHEKELLIEVERYDEPVGEYILGKIDPKDPFYNLTDKV